jgi:hypothetical protein
VTLPRSSFVAAAPDRASRKDRASTASPAQTHDGRCRGPHGDRKPSATFVARIRELPGAYSAAPASVDENITVLQGRCISVGEKYDRAAMKEMKAGSYAFIPKGTTMFGYTPEAAIVQVHGVGPFHIHWRAGNTWRDTLKTLDDPDAATVFKFKKGDRVVAGRRAGRIRQGYDSGEMIGYEIEGPDGNLFAAEEKDLRRDGKAH